MRHAALIAIEERFSGQLEGKEKLRKCLRAEAIWSTRREKIEKVMQKDAK